MRQGGHVWSPWSEDQTKTLHEAVAEYGVGQWAAILRDKVYGELLKGRSNVDLKDKWRVLERARIRNGGEPIEKSERSEAARLLKAERKALKDAELGEGGLPRKSSTRTKKRKMSAGLDVVMSSEVVPVLVSQHADDIQTLKEENLKVQEDNTALFEQNRDILKQLDALTKSLQQKTPSKK